MKFVLFTNTIRVIKSKDEMNGANLKQKKDEMPTKFWSENLKGRKYLEDLGTDGL
jgi:hypothetical protein